MVIAKIVKLSRAETILVAELYKCKLCPEEVIEKFMKSHGDQQI
jgi:hypothetical protein